MSKISIIASFINEQENLDLFINKIQETFEKLNKFDYEIIFVDDNSTDNSFSILERYFKSNKKIKVIKMHKRYGHSPSIQAALENISDNNYCVIIDCDMQDPPELITENLKDINHDETVHFIRKKRNDGFFQKIYSYIAYIILNFISGGKIFINAGYFKIMPPIVTEKIKNNNEYLPFWSYLITKLSIKNKKIYYSRKPRNRGDSKYNFFSINPWLTFYGGLYYFKLRYLGFSLTLLIFLIFIKNYMIFISSIFILNLIFNFIILIFIVNIISFLIYLYLKSQKKKIKCSYDLINF